MLKTYDFDYKKSGKELKKLTRAQIQALIIDYYSHDYNVGKLIRKYHLDLDAGQLFFDLPLRIIDKRCPYDNHHMERRLTARTAPKKSINTAFCPQCHHQDRDDCNCNNCLEYRKKQQRFKKRTMIQRLARKQYQKPFVAIQDISIRDILYLAILTKYFSNTKGSNIKGLSQSNLSFLGHFYDHDIIKNLLQKGLITIASSSSIEAFCFANDYRITRCRYLKANYILHIQGRRMSSSLKDASRYLINLISNISSSTSLFKGMDHEAAYFESVDFLYDELNKSNLASPSNNQLIDKMLNYLIYHFSIQQIFYMMNKVIINASHYRLKGHTSKRQAADFMMMQLKKYARLTVDDHWHIPSLSWPHGLKHSAFAQFIFHDVPEIS